MDCVAECIENDIVLVNDRPAGKKPAGIAGGSVRAVGSRVPAGSLGSPGVGSPRSKGPMMGMRASASGQMAGPSIGGAPVASRGDFGGTSPPEARARSPGNTPRWPTTNEVQRGRGEDRSPFRWLAPVLERVWGQSLSPCRSTSPCDDPQKPPARGRGTNSGSPTRGQGIQRARAKSPQVKGAFGDRPVGGDVGDAKCCSWPAVTGQSVTCA